MLAHRRTRGNRAHETCGGLDLALAAGSRVRAWDGDYRWAQIRPRRRRQRVKGETLPVLLAFPRKLFCCAEAVGRCRDWPLGAAAYRVPRESG
ncbi:hypothetical protein NDU88_006710 [Pleurodeles waltl]|uniref:Uncharacterized protein n=1 Tax=Pleurodeles waltl TaxID=8319 RepID=A0AAV7NV75_PLEWA|nr:hypothetical protein NDU88_006710 [Pleurodeles waltl]